MWASRNHNIIISLRTWFVLADYWCSVGGYGSVASATRLIYTKHSLNIAISMSIENCILKLILKPQLLLQHKGSWYVHPWLGSRSQLFGLEVALSHGVVWPNYRSYVYAQLVCWYKCYYSMHVCIDLRKCYCIDPGESIHRFAASWQGCKCTMDTEKE